MLKRDMEAVTGVIAKKTGTSLYVCPHFTRVTCILSLARVCMGRCMGRESISVPGLLSPANIR